MKAGLATTEDFNEYEKHGVICPYNSKAMAMFPRKVNDRIAIIFTLYPDYPPSKIAIAYFDSIKELLNPTKEYWREWMKYPEFQENIVMEAIPPRKYVEVGSPPIETDEGWLLIMPDITPEGVFNITAAMLDLEYPNKVIAKLKRPLLIPLAEYEREGNVPNVAFPTGALEKDGEIYIYYGAADKYIALGFIDKEKLVKYLMKEGRI